MDLQAPDLPYPPERVSLKKLDPESVYTLYPLSESASDFDRSSILDRFEVEDLELSSSVGSDLTKFRPRRYHIDETPFQLRVFTEEQVIIDVWKRADPEAFIWLHHRHLDRRQPFKSVEKALASLEKARRKSPLADLQLPSLIRRKGGLWQSEDRAWEITYLDGCFTVKNWQQEVEENRLPSLFEARLRIYLWERANQREWKRTRGVITGAVLRFGAGDPAEHIPGQPSRLHSVRSYQKPAY